MANTRRRRTVQEYALLKCGEFFRDEMLFGTEHLPARFAEKFTELRALCFDALDEPSVADADDIRLRYFTLMDEENEEADAVYENAEPDHAAANRVRRRLTEDSHV